MTLSHALYNAYSGLVASSRRAGVTAHNIANATTEGYARRQVELSAMVVAGQGSGVRVDRVTLTVNEPLTEDRRRAQAQLGAQTQAQTASDALARGVGGPDDPAALFKRYDALEATLRTLSNNPQSTLSQLDVLNKAKDLARTFNELNDTVLDLRKNADEEIGRQVDFINTTLTEFVEINKQVKRATVSGDDASEFIAQRDALIDDLAELMPLVVTKTENGGVSLTTDAGLFLADNSAATFAFTPANVITSDMDLVGGAPGTLSSLTVGGVDVTPTTTASNRLGAGKLSELFQTRDVTGVTFQTRIDALADDLVSRFSAASVEPSITVGDPGIFTDNGAASTGVAGAAGRLSINALVDPDQGGSLLAIRDGIGATAGDVGDNTHAIALLGAITSEQTAPTGSDLSGTKSATAFAADFASLISTEAERNDTLKAMRSSRFNTYYAAETSATGVDMDFEIRELTLIQTAYSANARVIETVDQMFRRLMEI